VSPKGRGKEKPKKQKQGGEGIQKIMEIRKEKRQDQNGFEKKGAVTKFFKRILLRTSKGGRIRRLHRNY